VNCSDALLLTVRITHPVDFGSTTGLMASERLRSPKRSSGDDQGTIEKAFTAKYGKHLRRRWPWRQLVRVHNTEDALSLNVVLDAVALTFGSGEDVCQGCDHDQIQDSLAEDCSLGPRRVLGPKMER